MVAGKNSGEMKAPNRQMAVVLAGPVGDLERPLLVLCTRLMMAAAAWRSMSKVSTAAAASETSHVFEDMMYPVLSLISIGGEMAKMIQIASETKVLSASLVGLEEPHRTLIREIITAQDNPSSPVSKQIKGMKLIRDRMYAHYDERVAKSWIDKVSKHDDPNTIPLYLVDPDAGGQTQRFPWAWWSILNQIAEDFGFSEISEVQEWQISTHRLSARTCVACEALAGALLATLPVKYVDWKPPIAGAKSITS